jgi:predicted nuclease of predicted toxin-antitoxin system
MGVTIQQASRSSSLADILEKILDKGVVVAGDIKVSLADVELLTVKIRLVICSVDKAMEIGINWWQADPNLNSLAASNIETGQINRLIEKIEFLEEELALIRANAQED